MRPLLAASLAAALLAMGCGSSPAPRPRPVATAPSAAAKHRYLAHFHPDCARAARLGRELSSRLSSLEASLASGDPAAVRRLADFFHRLGAALAAALTHDRHLGDPPDPGSDYARRYLAADAIVAIAFTKIGDALAADDAAPIAPDSRVVAQATREAAADARAYGIPQCQSAQPATAPALPAV